MMKSDKIFPLHPYKGETHKMTNYDQIRPGYSRLSNNFVTFMPYITDISFFMPHSNKIFFNSHKHFTYTVHRYNCALASKRLINILLLPVTPTRPDFEEESSLLQCKYVAVVSFIKFIHHKIFEGKFNMRSIR